MKIEFPDEFEEYSDNLYWGITPVSLMIANNAMVTGSDRGWEALRRHYELAVIRTNHEVPWDKYKETIEELCRVFFEEQSPLEKAAICVNPNNCREFVAGAICHLSPSGLSSVIIKGQEVSETTQGDVILSGRELKGYADEEDIRMLRSLGIIEPVRKGYMYDKKILSTLRKSGQDSFSEGAWILAYRILDALDASEPNKIVESILRDFDIAPPETVPDDAAGSLPVYILDKGMKELTEEFFEDGFAEYVEDKIEEINEEKQLLRESLRFDISESQSGQSVEWPMSDVPSVVCAVASHREVPVSARWVSEKEDEEPLSIHNELTQAGIAVTLENGMLRFKHPYESPEETGKNVLSDYQDWLYQRLSRLDDSERAYSRIYKRVEDRWVGQRRELLEESVYMLEDFTVSPTKFVYTIFDPEHHADEYNIDEYVGDSPHLEDEVRMMRRWSKQKPSDAVSFADMIPEILNYPLEEDGVAPNLRIMSPWINFAVQDYAAIINRLLKNGVQIQLLFRLPDSSDWDKLKNNLLTRIGDTEGNLELRTYTRYKRFRDHSELREVDEDNSEWKSETGIHAKLYIAGSPENGSVLAGSANLMENSFFYNPEAGIQTKNPNVIRTASEYFDLVWEASKPDKIPESVFLGKTEYSFYPKVYRP